MGRVSPPKEIKAILCKKLKTLREERHPGYGGSLKLAEELGVLPQQWSQWETGKRVPIKQQLYKIAEFFGIDPDELLPQKIQDALNRDKMPKGKSSPEAAVAMSESLEVIEYICKLRQEVIDGRIAPADFTAMMQDILKYSRFVAIEAKRRADEDAEQQKNQTAG